LSTNTGNAKNFPDGGYLKLKKSQKVPVDAWDRDLQYSSDGKNYSLFSFGSDGVAGGEGNDADIDSAE
jgi:general secretion pathway protein G